MGKPNLLILGQMRVTKKRFMFRFQVSYIDPNVNTSTPKFRIDLWFKNQGHQYHVGVCFKFWDDINNRISTWYKRI